MGRDEEGAATTGSTGVTATNDGRGEDGRGGAS